MSNLSPFVRIEEKNDLRIVYCRADGSSAIYIGGTRILIIGEATKRLNIDFRNAYTHVPWKDMAVILGFWKFDQQFFLYRCVGKHEQ